MKRSMKYGSNYWEGYSPKLKRTVRFFSDLEYGHWLIIETDPSVVIFCEQPVKIKHSFNNEVIESIIDMWIKYNNNEEYFYEIKYSKELDNNNSKSARAIEQISVQKSWCEENGYNYRVRTEIDIRANDIYLCKLKRIISFVRNINILNEIDKHQIMCVLNNGLKSF